MKKKINLPYMFCLLSLLVSVLLRILLSIISALIKENPIRYHSLAVLGELLVYPLYAFSLGCLCFSLLHLLGLLRSFSCSPRKKCTVLFLLFAAMAMLMVLGYTTNLLTTINYIFGSVFLIRFLYFTIGAAVYCISQTFKINS